jgi:hypothetical protein
MNQLEPNNNDALVELSSANIALSSLFLKRQEYLAAKKVLQISFDITKRLLTMMPGDILFIIDKANIFSWLATTEQHLGHLSLSMELHKKGQYELESALKAKPEDAFLLQNLSYSFVFQTRVLYYKNEFSLAIEKASFAIDILLRLAQQDPENEIWSEDLLRIQVFKRLLISKSNQQEKETLFNELSMDSEADLAKKTTDIRTIISLIKYYQNNELWHVSAIFITRTKELLKKHKISQEPDYILAFSELNLAEARQFKHDNARSKLAVKCKKAIENLNPLVRLSHHVKYLLPYAQAYSCLNKLDEIPSKIDSLMSMGINQFNL